MYQKLVALPKWQRVARTASLAMLNVYLMIGADKASAPSLARPHPHGFGTPTPVPSSLLLVMVGFAALLGWNWWRTRVRSAASTDN